MRVEADVAAVIGDDGLNSGEVLDLSVGYAASLIFTNLQHGPFQPLSSYARNNGHFSVDLN